MAHFAKLDENNYVIAVHVVNNDVLTVDGSESEETGIEFLTNLHKYSKWKQTSYNKKIRKNFAGIGFFYDQTLDAFIPPKPYASWVLDFVLCNWKTPVPKPDEADEWLWNEESLSWVLPSQS